MAKLGNSNLELKQERYDATRAICLEKRDLLTVLPTGFGKSLCYQALPGIKNKVKVNKRLGSHRCVAVECTDPGSVAEVKRLCECLYFAKYRGR